MIGLDQEINNPWRVGLKKNSACARMTELRKTNYENRLLVGRTTEKSLWNRQMVSWGHELWRGL